MALFRVWYRLLPLCLVSVAVWACDDSSSPAGDTSAPSAGQNAAQTMPAGQPQQPMAGQETGGLASNDMLFSLFFSTILQIPIASYAILYT